MEILIGANGRVKSIMSIASIPGVILALFERDTDTLILASEPTELQARIAILIQMLPTSFSFEIPVKPIELSGIQVE